MQANKIKIGDIYAVRVHGELARYRVLAATTKRTLGGTSTLVEGELLDAIRGHEIGDRCQYDAGDIIGDYKEVAELAARDQREREAASLAAQQKQDRAEAILAAFCKLIGVPKPKRIKTSRHSDSTGYDHTVPFRLDYSNTIEINRDGMDILAKFLKVDQ